MLLFLHVAFLMGIWGNLNVNIIFVLRTFVTAFGGRKPFSTRSFSRHKSNNNCELYFSSWTCFPYENHHETSCGKSEEDGWMRGRTKENPIENDRGKEIKLQIFSTKIKFELRNGKRNYHEVLFPMKSRYSFSFLLLPLACSQTVISGLRKKFHVMQMLGAVDMSWCVLENPTINIVDKKGSFWVGNTRGAERIDNNVFDVTQKAFLRILTIHIEIELNFTPRLVVTLHGGIFQAIPI